MERKANQVRRLFRGMRVMDMPTLESRAEGRSRRSLYRDLSKLGYFSSFSHVGRYYTLQEIPAFDELGLWFHEGVGFSRAGTLKETVAQQVEEAPDGRTHAELRHVLRLRVHNTLLELVRRGRIGRKRWRRVNLYVSAKAERAAEQLERRQEANRVLAESLRTLTAEETIEVLVEALRTAPEIPPHTLVAERLAARGVRIEPRLVLQVYESYGMVAEKKTPPSRSSQR